MNRSISFRALCCRFTINTCAAVFSVLALMSVASPPLAYAGPSAGSPEGAVSIATLSCGCGAMADASGNRCVCQPGYDPLTSVDWSSDTQGNGLICGRKCGKDEKVDLSVGAANNFCRACLPEKLPCGTEANLTNGPNGMDYKVVCKPGRRPLSDLNPLYPTLDTCAEPCADGAAPDPGLHILGTAKDPAACAYCPPKCACGQKVVYMNVPGGQVLGCECEKGRSSVDSIVHNGDQRCFNGPLPSGHQLRGDLFDKGTVAPEYENRCVGFLSPARCGWDTTSIQPKKDSSGKITGDLEYTGACKPGWVHVNDVVHNGDMRCFDPNLVPAGQSITGELYDQNKVDAAYADRCMGHQPTISCGFERAEERDGLGRITGNFVAQLKSGYVWTAYGDVAKACPAGFHHSAAYSGGTDCRTCEVDAPPVCSGSVWSASYTVSMKDGWTGSGSTMTGSSVSCSGATPSGAGVTINGTGDLGSVNNVAIEWDGGGTVHFSWYRRADNFGFDAYGTASRVGNIVNFSVDLPASLVKHHHGGGTASGYIDVSCSCTP